MAACPSEAGSGFIALPPRQTDSSVMTEDIPAMPQRDQILLEQLENGDLNEDEREIVIDELYKRGLLKDWQLSPCEHAREPLDRRKRYAPPYAPPSQGSRCQSGTATNQRV